MRTENDVVRNQPARLHRGLELRSTLMDGWDERQSRAVELYRIGLCAQ